MTYSNRARGLRAKNAAACPVDPATLPGSDAPAWPVIAEPAWLDRRRWAALIEHVYQADPLQKRGLAPSQASIPTRQTCSREVPVFAARFCCGTLDIIAFIEPHQAVLIRKILEHCGLWHDPAPRAPPPVSRPSRTVRSSPEPDCARGITHEVDPDFLEHVHREAVDQPELPWEP
jgi:hypothetical protein